jgi:hypothetical protein
MEEFKKWRYDPGNLSCLGDEDSEDNFGIFYQYYTQQQSFFEMLAKLAHQIYELQVCMEGIIQDQEG